MDKVAVVTGASPRVGRGIAIALLDSGFRVFATGRSVESADCQPASPDCGAITCATNRPQPRSTA